MTEKEEAAFDRGYRAAWALILNEAVQKLGYDSTEASGWNWIIERESAIQTLRSICELRGDNDWPDNLHLSDIIEKHLAAHLLRRA